MRTVHAAWATLTLAGMLLLGACGTNAPPQAEASGNAARGKQLFTGEAQIAGGSVPICADCHSVEPGEVGVIGPNLSNIGNRAAETIPGMSATEYLRQSIVDPDAHLAGGFQEGIHYRGYGEALTDDDLNDLVTYLSTLQSGQDS
jgi:cytochrome c2